MLEEPIVNHQLASDLDPSAPATIADVAQIHTNDIPEGTNSAAEEAPALKPKDAFATDRSMSSPRPDEAGVYVLEVVDEPSNIGDSAFSADQLGTPKAAHSQPSPEIAAASPENVLRGGFRVKGRPDNRVAGPSKKDSKGSVARRNGSSKDKVKQDDTSGVDEEGRVKTADHDHEDKVVPVDEAEDAVGTQNGDHGGPAPQSLQGSSQDVQDVLNGNGTTHEEPAGEGLEARSEQGDEVENSDKAEREHSGRPDDAAKLPQQDGEKGKKKSDKEKSVWMRLFR